VEGWERVRDARGRSGTHHLTYELALEDGRILRTRISHPVNRDTYGLSLWSHILRDQLDVTADEFWDCARNGALPQRSRPQVIAEGLPLSLVHQLISQLGMSEDDVRSLSKEQAIERLSQLWGVPE
jgi:hypothetical protein